MIPPGRIACFRTDRIGDLVLAMPAMAALAARTPGGKVTAVVAPRTASLVAGQPWIEDTIAWSPGNGVARLVRLLRRGRFDAAVFFYPRASAAIAAVLAGIPARVGPAARWYAPLFTHRVPLHRSENRKHEAEYNFDLLAPFGVGAPNGERLVPPVVAADARAAADALLREAGVAGGFVVVHPGSGGSALNAGPEHYGRIARAIEEGGRPVVITGADAERGLMESTARVAGLPANRCVRPASLAVLGALLARATAVVGPSTGPLHLAAALGLPTVALFPPLQAQQPLRWRPWSAQGSVVVPHPALCPACLGAACPLYNCLERVLPADVARAVADVTG